MMNQRRLRYYEKFQLREKPTCFFVYAYRRGYYIPFRQDGYLTAKKRLIRQSLAGCIHRTGGVHRKPNKGGGREFSFGTGTVDYRL